MKTIIQATIATLAAFAPIKAEAKSIHNSCLTMSDAVAGIEEGDFMTNEAQLTSRAVTDDMRLHSITTCHTDGKVTGLQFHMALDPAEAIDEDVYDMAPLGLMSGQCVPLELPDGLDKIKATINSRDSTVSLVYKHDGTDLKQKYGDQGDERTAWTFTQENPLVGLYGRQTEKGIAQLGFIVLDTACQLAHVELPEPDNEPVKPEEPAEPIVEPVEEPVEPQPVEPVEEPVEPQPVESSDPIEPSEPIEPIVESTDPVPVEPDFEPTEPQKKEQEPKDEGVLFGLSLLSIILIVGGVLLLTILATVSICTVVRHKGHTGNAMSPSSPPKPRLTRRSEKPKELVPVYPETDIENNAHPAIGIEESAAKNLNAEKRPNKITIN